MIYFTDTDIDRLIEDDVPAGDMTTELLDLAGQQGTITLSARDEICVCCTEEAVRMYKKAGLEVTYWVPSGSLLKKGDKLLEAKGDAASIHLIWRTGGALIECASGIANRTHQLVTLAKAENQTLTVAGTRKHPPFLKKIALKALQAGGAVPHRTGLSDTILIFREHLLFTGGYQNLPQVIHNISMKQKERKIVVEAHTLDEAIVATEANADAVQVDKMNPEQFRELLLKCKAINPKVCIIAAGGINANNAAAYASMGADVLVTSWVYFAPPADVKVTIVKEDNN